MNKNVCIVFKNKWMHAKIAINNIILIADTFKDFTLNTAIYATILLL